MTFALLIQYLLCNEDQDASFNNLVKKKIKEELGSDGFTVDDVVQVMKKYPKMAMIIAYYTLSEHVLKGMSDDEMTERGFNILINKLHKIEGTKR